MIEVSSLILLLMMAVAAGAIVGLMPGLNPVLGLIICLPFLSRYDPYEIIIFWVCYICVTQYYGSVAALFFRLPGEVSSLPVLHQSKDLKSVRSIIKAYRLTALGSYIASVLALIMLAMITWTLQDSWHVLFRTQWMAVFFMIVFVLLLVTNKHRIIALSLVIIGLFLSNIGKTDLAISACRAYDWLCFSLRPSDINLAIVCLYAVPFLFYGIYFSPRTVSGAHNIPPWTNFWKFRYTAIKHGFLGFLIGFVPGMGATLASNIGAAIEKHPTKPRRLRTMCAAESANNSAVISCTIPFLFLGIPITGTELVLDSWFLVNQALAIGAEFYYNKVSVGSLSIPYPWMLILMVFLLNTMCFILVSRFTWIYHRISLMPAWIFSLILKISVSLILIYSIMLSDLSRLPALINLVLFSAVGIWAQKKNIEVSALPIAMLVGSLAVDKIIAAYYITF